MSVPDTHLKAEHSCGESEYRVLSRDQVVDMLTLQKTAAVPSSSSSQPGLQGSFQTDYVCFYCDDVVGSIYEVKAHFGDEHDPANDKFKVKRSQAGGKKVRNYVLLCSGSCGGPI